MFLQTFGHNFGRKSVRDVLEGSLEAYYEAAHEKMTKSEVWAIMGDWGQVTKFYNFCPKSF